MSCIRCGGTGLIEFTSGTFRSEFYVRGVLVVEEREATDDKPLYRRCSCQSEKPARPIESARVYD